MLCILSLYSVICQLYLNKAGGKSVKKSENLLQVLLKHLLSEKRMNVPNTAQGEKISLRRSDILSSES